MRLGEALVAERVISEGQLQEALDAQLTYGGHLGTCLIELGYLSEDRLGQVLAASFGVPCAPPGSFEDIPRFILNALPQSIVEKHAAIPIRLNDGILDVAMIDPRSTQAIDELRLASGHAIRSWVAPEVRIFQAMDRYYDVPRRIRYVALCRTLDKGRPAAERGASFAKDAATPRAASAVALAAVPDPLEAVSHRLCMSKTENEIADLVLGAMHGDLRRRVLFKVQGGSAYVWRARGAELDLDAVQRVRFPILSEPIFGLLRGDDHYAGPLPSDPINLGFYRKLGIATPHQILLLPAHQNDRLVAMFYGDCGRRGTIGVDIEKHRRLLAKAALAIEIVQTKSRILAL